MIFDAFFQTGNKINIHVKYAAAFFASHMAMVVTSVIKTICSARNFHFPDFACFLQQVQIPIYRCPADIRVILGNGLIDLVRGGMTLQFVNNFQN